MKSCKKILLLVLLLIQQIQSGSANVASLFAQKTLSLSAVLEKYEEALDDLIAVYAAQSPPMPIQFVFTDIIGSTFDKIIHPYVVELTGLSAVVMSGFARKYSYFKDMQIMFSKFEEYQQKIQTISKKFPSKQQVVAVQYFYKQLVPMVQTCAKIVRGVTDALDLNDASIQAAQLAFELAFKAQTPTMKLTGFTSVTSFQSTMINGMISLYNAAINKAQESITNGKNIDATLKKIAEYYQEIEKVYTIAGQTQQAALAKQNYENANQNAQSFFKSEFMMKEAEKEATQARMKLIIDFVNPGQTNSALTTSLTNLHTAIAMYQQVQQIYSSIGYGPGIQLIKTKTEELQADQYIRYIQILWTMFLQDTYVQGSTSKIKAFSELENLYKQDPSKQQIQIDVIVDSLKQLIEMISTVPNMYSDKLSLQALLKSAIQLYQTADSGHPQGTSSDRLANMELLQTIQTVYGTMLTLLQGMVEVAKSSSSETLLVTAGAIMQQAQKLDDTFDKEDLIKNFCVYFPNLDTDAGIAKKSFVSFVAQYLYRICMIKALEILHSNSESDKNNTSNMVESVTYFIFIKQYQHYLSSDQIAIIGQLQEKSLIHINIQSEAEKAYVKAKNSSNWKNSITNKNDLGLVYQSSTDSLWQKAIHIYEIALQVDPSIELRRSYVTALQTYIKSYMANVSKYNGYQLHVIQAVHKLYLGAVALDNDQLLFKSVQEISEQLFSDISGLCGQLTQLSDIITNKIKQTQQKLTNQDQALDSLKNLLQICYKVYMQSKFSIPVLQRLFVEKKEITSAIDYIDKGETIEIQINLGATAYSVQVANPKIVEIDNLESEAEKLFDAAQQFVIQQKFIDAQNSYKNLLTIYSHITQLAYKQSDIKKYQQKMFLAKTLYAACNISARVSFAGLQVVGNIANVPEKYYVTEFVQTVDTKLLGLSIPASLNSLKSATPQIIQVDEERLAAREVFKAFLIDKLLREQGLQFKDCFIDYQFTIKSGLGKTDMDLAQQAEKTVEEYIQDFDNKVVMYVTVQGTQLFLKFDNMPLPAVAPMYQGGLFAAVYFVEAATLFQPGTELVSVGGAAYVPGQDQEATDLMYENIAYAYIADAQKHLVLAQTNLQSVVKTVTNAVKAGKKITLDDVSVLYNSSKKNFIRAQALLYATGGSAYYYCNQAKNNTKAQQVKEFFLSVYKNQTDLLQQLIIGNPLSDLYTTVAGDINQAYVSWNSELDVTNEEDAAQIEKNKNAIITLYTTAAQNCMNYVYTDPMFPNFKQHHYMKAAENYKAAYKEYDAAHDDVNSKKTLEKVLHADYQACNQNIEIYFGAKKNGVVYIPVAMFGSTSQKPKSISFDQLNRNYQNFAQSGANINSGELSAYNAVKKLLLDASMFYQYIGSQYMQLDSKQTTAAIELQKKGLNPALLSYLKEQNILDNDATSIMYTQPGMLQKLFGITNDLYENFSSNNEVLSAWCSVLNLAVANLYINDYLGGSTGSQDFTSKWQEFFQAVQKEGSSLQNPASEYVG